MRILFDAQIISERGTSVALHDYARHAEECLGIESIIAWRGMSDPGNEKLLTNFTDRFTCVPYSEEADLQSLVRRERADVYYRLISGREKALPFDTAWRAHHIVFQHDRSQPDVCAYISQWLSDDLTGGLRPFVPHIVELPQPGSDMRKELGIPASALVIGRHGGHDTFNIPFLPKVIERLLETRGDIWFVFVNTDPFLNHERILYLPPIISLTKKADFISACDLMLHGRIQGESFGLAIAEFLFLHRPAMCWIGGSDRNHLNLQTDPALIYSSAQDLFNKLRALRHDTLPKVSDEQAHRFRAAPVMQKFQEVFLTIDRSTEPAHLAKRGLAPTPAPTRARRLLRKHAVKMIDRLSYLRSSRF